MVVEIKQCQPNSLAIFDKQTEKEKEAQRETGRRLQEAINKRKRQKLENEQPRQVIEELLAKISAMEEELEISREQVKSLEQELTIERQTLGFCLEELKACKEEMETLNTELQNCYQQRNFEDEGVTPLSEME